MKIEEMFLPRCAIDKAGGPQHLWTIIAEDWAFCSSCRKKGGFSWYWPRGARHDKRYHWRQDD